MNDLDLCLEVVSSSRQPLRYIRRWIWPIKWSRDRWQRCCEAVQSAILATAWLLVMFMTGLWYALCGIATPSRLCTMLYSVHRLECHISSPGMFGICTCEHMGSIANGTLRTFCHNRSGSIEKTGFQHTKMVVLLKWGKISESYYCIGATVVPLNILLLHANIYVRVNIIKHTQSLRHTASA